jgi:hypothetical protein
VSGSRNLPVRDKPESEPPGAGKRVRRHLPKAPGGERGALTCRERRGSRLDRAGSARFFAAMKSLVRGVIYGGAFVASYTVTHSIGAEWFAPLGDWVHVGRALFSFTVGYWAGKLASVLTK